MTIRGTHFTAAILVQHQTLVETFLGRHLQLQDVSPGDNLVVRAVASPNEALTYVGIAVQDVDTSVRSVLGYVTHVDRPAQTAVLWHNGRTVLINFTRTKIRLNDGAVGDFSDIRVSERLQASGVFNERTNRLRSQNTIQLLSAVPPAPSPCVIVPGTPPFCP